MVEIVSSCIQATLKWTTHGEKLAAGEEWTCMKEMMQWQHEEQWWEAAFEGSVRREMHGAEEKWLQIWLWTAAWKPRELRGAEEVLK